MKDFLYLSGLSLICGMIVSYATLFFLKKYLSNLGGDKGKENEIRWSKQRVPTMGGIILIAAFLSDRKSVV